MKSILKAEFYIVLDIGGTIVKTGIFRENKLLEIKETVAFSHLGIFESLPYFFKEIEDLISKHDARKKLGGIGFAFAGLVDVKNKSIISTNDKYHSSNKIDIEKWVNQNWKVPFFIDNDARMAAVGEWKYGVAKTTKDLVMVTLGTGIGTSAVINGKLLRGKHFQAGCLGGHFIINVNGNKCNCGNHGCAEAYASSWALRSRMQIDPEFEKSILAGSGEVNYKKIFKAANERDRWAKMIVEESVEVWAATIINLIHAYDPEIVVMGGGIMGSAEVIIPAVSKKVHDRAWTPWGKVQIVASQLKNSAALYGLNYCLQNEI